MTLKVKRLIITSKIPKPPPDAGKSRAVQLRTEAQSGEGGYEKLQPVARSSEYNLCRLTHISRGWGDARQSWGGAKGELLTLQTKWAVRTSGTEGVGGGERPVDSTFQLPSSISEQRSAQRRSEKLGLRAAATRAERVSTPATRALGCRN